MTKNEIISRMQQAKSVVPKEQASLKKCKTTSKNNTTNPVAVPSVNSSSNKPNNLSKKGKRVSKKSNNKSRHAITEDYSQNMIPVKSIIGGMILTTNNTYVKILEVLPINFDNLSNREKNSVVDAFYQYRRIAPDFIHLKSFTVQPDITDMISNIKYTCQNETNPAFQSSLQDYINHLQNLSSKQTVTKRYFVIFQYEPKNRASSSDINTVYQQVNERVIDAKRAFLRMGNVILDHPDENLFQGEVLYRFFNRKTSRKETFNERIFRISSDTKLYYESIHQKVPENADIRSFLAPKGLQFINPDYYIMDGLYYTHVILTANGHPYKTFGGWLNTYDRCGIDNIDIDVYCKKLDHTITKELVERTLTRKTVSANTATKETDQDDYINSANNNKYIFDMMKAGEDLYDCCIMFTLFSEDAKLLMTNRNALLKDLTSNGLYAMDCYCLCQNCFRMAMPLTYIDSKIWGPNKRNYLTSSFSNLYMFCAYQLFDPNGFLLGINAQNLALCITNLFNTQLYKNANMAIAGVSGAGKTFTLQYLGRNMRFSGIRVFYILPEKGYEQKRSCEAIGGSYIKIAPMENTCINIMEIRPEVSFDDTLIDDNIDIPAGCLLSKKIAELSVFVQLLMGKTEMTIEESNQFDIAMTELYGDFGITNDNESIFNPDGTLKTMPIISDMYNKLQEYNLSRLASVLDPFVRGTCSNMNGQTNVDMDNEYTVYDVDKQSIGERYLAAFLFLVMVCVYSIVRSSRLKNAAVFIDELWRLLVKESSATQVVEMIKLFRGYGGGVITATQEITDLLGDKNKEYGRAIFNNSASKLILHLEDTELDYVSSVMNLTENDRKLIKSFERGQGLFVSSNGKIPIILDASQKMISDYTTDTNELRKLSRKKKPNS